MYFLQSDIELATSEIDNIQKHLLPNQLLEKN